MRAISAAQNSKAKRILAGLLAVWMSGIIFLFCCGTPKTQTADIESCPLAKAGHCKKSVSDKAAADENLLRFATDDNGGPLLDCCGFLPKVFDRIRKSESSPQIAFSPATQVKPIAPPIQFAKTEPNNFLSYCPRPINRSGTYLKNQVFRI